MSESGKGKGGGITFRPRPDLRDRLDRLAEKTERDRTYFIDKCIEAHLPTLEEKYKDEIDAVRRRKVSEQPQDKIRKRKGNHDRYEGGETV